MQDVVGRVYLSMALSGLDPSHNKVYGTRKILEAGLAFVDSATSPVLGPVRACLMATKAILSLVTLAAEKGCAPLELFSNAWTWKPPKADKELKSEQKPVPPSSLPKKPKKSIKNPENADKTKVVKPEIRVTGSSTKTKGLVSMTPVMVKSKPSDRELSTLAPTLACTPVKKVKAPSSVQSTQKAKGTASKQQFHVYEELSPVQDKVGPVPAAPRRTKKSLFKVGIGSQ